MAELEDRAGAAGSHRVPVAGLAKNLITPMLIDRVVGDHHHRLVFWKSLGHHRCHHFGQRPDRPVGGREETAIAAGMSVH